MLDEHKTRQQLLDELEALRQQISESRAVETHIERKLREEKEKFRAVVQNSHAGILTIDDAYQFTYVNEKLCRILGYSREELIGQDFRALLDEDSRQIVAKRYVQRQAGEETPSRYEFNIIRKDGEKRRVEISSTVIKNSAGNVQTVAQVLDITEHKRAEKEVLRRTAQLEALRKVGLRLTAELDLDALLHSIVSQAIELLGGSSGGIDLYQPERDLLEWTAAIGPNMAPIGTVIHRGEGLSGKVWETGEPLIVDDYQHWEGRAESWKAFPITSIVGVPICWGDEFLGSLVVHAPSQRIFSPADAELLSLLANQTAIAIRNARVYKLERKRVTQLTVVNQVAQKMISILDLDQLLKEIVTAIQQGFEYYNVTLLLLDESASYLEMKAIAGGFEDIVPPDYRQAVSNGMVGWTTESGQPLLSNDVRQEPRYIAGFLDKALTQSELCVPLKLADHGRSRRRLWTVGQAVGNGRTTNARNVHVIGVLDVQDTQLNAFDDTDLMAMEILADQIAAAIENARLVASLAQEKERLGLLYRLSHHLPASLDVHTVAQRALDGACAVTGAQHGVLLVQEPGSDYLRPAAVFGPHVESIDADIDHASVDNAIPMAHHASAMSATSTADQRLWLQVGEGLNGWVAAHREVALVDDVTQDERWKVLPGIDDQMRAALSVPLVSRDELVGTLGIYSDQKAFFKGEHRQLVESAAAIVALSIANARHFEEEQHRRQEAETLRQAALSLTTALDRNEVIERILAQLQEVVPYDTASVQLFQEDRMELVGGRGFPNLPDLLGSSFPVNGDNPNSEVVRTRAPFIVADAPAMYGEFQREPHAQAGIRSWLGVPMLLGERLVGMIALDRHEPGFYTRDHARMAEAFAAQAAIVIENSRLFHAEQEQRDLSEALAKAASAVNSTLEIDRVLDHILEQVERVVPGDTFNVMMLENDVARRVRWRGYEYLEDDYTLNVEIPLAKYPSLLKMKDSGKSVVIPDTSIAPEWISSADQDWRQSYVAAPIRVGNTTVGILNVASTQTGRFGPPDAQRLEAFADHTAAAIENARLYQETAHRLAQAEVLREMMIAAASTLDFDQVLEQAIDVLGNTLGVEYLSFVLPEEDGKVMSSHPATLGFALPEGTFRCPADQCVTGRAYRTRQPVILPDVREAADYVAIEPEVRSELAIPVEVGDEVVGVLNLENSQPNAFDEEDLTFYTAVAGQLGVAMQNARMYQELQDYAQFLEERVQERTTEIQAQYARLNAILRSVSDGIIVTDRTGEIRKTNPVAQTWLSQTLSPKEAEKLRDAVQDLAMRVEERPETMLELTGLDLELKAAPVETQAATEEPAAVVAAHDVSHLKVLDRMKTRFVSNVSHELRTPVTTIKLYAALMQRNPKKWKEYIRPLAQEADRQAQLVEDILQISRIDAGRLEMKPTPTPLNELTRCTVVNHQMLAQAQGIKLQHRPLNPGPTVPADTERMMQVLNNLVENAINYTPKGGEVIVSTGKQDAEGRVWATASIADTGMGIPEEELPNIFGRFFRGEKVRLMQISGTGLGLAIAKEIVELHGGRITVESKVDKGSTFTIWLPLVN